MTKRCNPQKINVINVSKNNYIYTYLCIYIFIKLRFLEGKLFGAHITWLIDRRYLNALSNLTYCVYIFFQITNVDVYVRRTKINIIKKKI